MNQAQRDQAARQIEDLRHDNQRRIEEIMRDPDSTPDDLMRAAELDGRVDPAEARIVAVAHNEFVARADAAVRVWAGKHGHQINLARGDTLRVVPQRPEPHVITMTSEPLPLVQTFTDVGDWILSPRRRQKLTWLAIVIPAVVICLMELL